MFDGPYLEPTPAKRKRRRRLPAGQAQTATRDGPVAILVTDLEGFTPLVCRLGDVAAQRVIQAQGVNTAVRICSVTEAGHVLVSDLVWRLAAGRRFAFHQRGAVALKGIGQPLDLYELHCGARAGRLRD